MCCMHSNIRSLYHTHTVLEESSCFVICRFASFARLIGDASQETKELLREFNIVEVSSMVAKS